MSAGKCGLSRISKSIRIWIIINKGMVTLDLLLILHALLKVSKLTLSSLRKFTTHSEIVIYVYQYCDFCMCIYGQDMKTKVTKKLSSHFYCI